MRASRSPVSCLQSGLLLFSLQSFSLSMYIKISECVDGRHRQTFGVTWADYDGDGDVDCFMSNYV